MQAGYARLVEDGSIPDTKQSWTIYVNGWCDSDSFRYDVADLQNAGGGYHSFTAVFWLIGGLLTLLPIFLLLVFPPEEFVLRRLAMMTGVGVGLLLLGTLPYKKGRKVYASAVAKHREVWGTPQIEKSVDEPEESS